MTRLQSPQLAAPQQASSISAPQQINPAEVISDIDSILAQADQPQSAPFQAPPGLATPDVGPWSDEKASQVFHSTPDRAMAAEALGRSSDPLSLFADSIDEMWQNASPDVKAQSFTKLMNDRAAQVAGQTLGDNAKKAQYADDLEKEAQRTYPGLKVPKEYFVKMVGMHEDANALVTQWGNQSHFDSIYSTSMDLSRKYKDPEDRAEFLDIVRRTTKAKIGGQADGMAGEAISNIGAGGSDIAGSMVRFLNSYTPFVSRRDERADELEFMNNLKQAGRAGAFEPPADRGFVQTGILEAFRQLPAMAVSTAGVGGAGPELASGGKMAAAGRAAGQAWKAGKGVSGAVRAGMGAARTVAPEVAAEMAAATQAAEAAAAAAPGVMQAGKAAWAAAPTTTRAIGSSLGAAAKAAISKAPVEALKQTAFWTTQIAPQIEQDLVESGISRDIARPAALITGAIEGALENLNERQLYGPAIKKWGQGGLKRYFGEVAKQYLKEWGEEFNQAGAEVLGKAAATYADGKPYDWAAGWKEVQDQTIQAAIPVAVMQAPGSAMGAMRQHQGAQQRQGDLLRADILRQMDPATRKAFREGNEEIRRQIVAKYTGNNIYPMSEDDMAKLYDLAHAEAPAGMKEAVAGRQPGERVSVYQDRMKTIADQYDTKDQDARVGTVKRYYDSMSKALQDFMRGQTERWPQAPPLSPEDEEYVPLPTFQPQDQAPAEPDDYGWQPIQKDPAAEHAKIRAAMAQVRQTESGKLMNRKQVHAEALKIVDAADEEDRQAENQAAVEMYQDPRAAALFYLFGIEDAENPAQSRPDAGRHLAVANRPDHAKSFEEHGLPSINGVRGGRVIRSKFVNAIRQFAELPRGLVKEIARLATSDTEALTEDAGGNVKIDRTWRKYPAGSTAPGMVFHDTPFGRFGRRDIPGDPELAPFTYEEAGNWIASLQGSQNAPESIQEPQAPITDQAPAPQGGATPVAQASDPPVQTPSHDVAGPKVTPELQAEIDKAAQEGDVDRLVELMNQAQDQVGTTPPFTTPPAPVTPSVTAPPTPAPAGAPPVKPAAKTPDVEVRPGVFRTYDRSTIPADAPFVDGVSVRGERPYWEYRLRDEAKSDRISELEAQVKDLGKRTKSASDSGDTETAQRLAAEAGKLIDEIGSLEKSKPAQPKSEPPKPAEKPRSAIDDISDLMAAPKDWRDAATQIAAGATSLATEVTLPDLYAALSARFPGLTHEEFRKGMRELHDQRKLVLGDYTGKPDDVAGNPAAILFEKDGRLRMNDDWKFYVRSAPPKVTAKNPKPAPATKQKTAEDVIYDNLPKPVQRVVDDLRKHAKDKGHAGFTLAEEPDAGWTILAMDLAERISGKTGTARTMPVVWFRGDIGNGMQYKGVVFLNADLSRPDNLWGVIAHEVSHLLGIDESLKFDDPDLMDQLRDEYYWKSSPAQRSILKSNERLWNKEAIAYLIDRLFHNADFRTKMQQEKPTVWQKIVAAFRRFFDRFYGSKKWDPKDPANSLAQKHLDKIQEVFMGAVPTKVRALSSVPEVTPSKFPELDEIMFSPMKDVAQYLRDRYKSTANEEKFFSRYMQDALRALQVQVSARTRKGNISKAGIRKAVDKYMEDVSEYLAANPSKAEYYANEAHRERAELVKVFPELEHDEVWSAYQMLNGMASAQTNLGQNTQETIDAWAMLREKGEIPTKKVTGEDGKQKLAGDGFVVHGGPSSRNKINNYRAFNKLLKKHGSVGEVAAFLTGSVSRDGLLQLRKELGWATIGEIADILNTVQHATGQTEAIPRMFIFGPKVGAYSLNRMGDYRYQTIDVWESRLARFYLSDIRFKPGQTGLLEGDDRKIAQEFGKLVAEELGLDAAAAQAVRWYHFKGFVKELGYGKVKEEDLKTISEITAGRLAQREGDGSGSTESATRRTHAVIRGSGRGIEARRRAAAEKIRDNLGSGNVADDNLYLAPRQQETPAERVEKQKAFNKVVAKYVMEQKRYATYLQLIKEIIDAKGGRDAGLAKVLQYEHYLKTAWNTARALIPQYNLQVAEDVGSMFPANVPMIGEPASDLSKIYAQASGTDRLFIAMDDDNEQIATLSPAAIKTIQKAIADGGSVHIDLGSWSNFADSQGKGWNRVLEGVGKILAGMDRGKAGRINIILPDVFGNQTESHQLQKVVAGKLRTLADSGVSFVVPIQKGDSPISKYVGWTMDLGLPPSSLVLGIPIGGRQWSQENIIEYAANEADNAVMQPRIHLMGVTNRDAGSIGAYIKGVNPKAVVTGENSARHRGEEGDHLEGIGKAFSREMRKHRLKLKKEGDQWILTDTKEDFKPHQGTYNNQDWIKNIGGVWNQSRHGYVFSKDPRQDIYNNLTRRKRELEEKKRQEDARADKSVLSKPASEIVSKETRDAINAGSKAGVNADTLKGQIEDIARVSEAIGDNRGAFILASGTGTGKTFVLGGVVRENLDKFSKVIWVTKNKDLVAQAKRDIKAFGLKDDAIDFMTYAALSTSGAADAQGALLIFDESHEINNFVPDEKGVDRRQTRSERAVEAQGMIKAARFTVFSSATPMRNPVDAGYIASTGIFDRVGGFVEWAQIYGADVAKTIDGTLTVHWSRGGRESLNRTTEARHWLLRQGIFSKQKVHLPTKDGKPLVHTMFKTVKLDQDRLKRYNDVMAAYQKAMADNSHLIAQIKRHSENVYKRLTEFLKAPEAIKEAQRIIDANGQVVVFTDYKSDSWIGRYQYSERYRKEHGIKDADSEMFPAAVVVERMEQWKKEAAMARQMGDTPPTQPFADEIFAIAKACAEMKLEFKMDSTLDLFAQAFNKDEIGFFTGPIKTDFVSVTSKSRESDKEKWLRNKKKILVATIGSGGTGLSLHDTTGKMPTRMQLGIALPWTGVQTEQAAGRLARQGIQKETGIVWMFAEGITFEKSLAARVGARLNDMGGLLTGIENPQGSALEDFDFEGNFDPLTGGVARELQIEVGANTQENDYGFVQGKESEEGGTQEGEEGRPEEGSEDAEGDVEYAEGVDEGVTEKDGFKVGDLVEYADPGDPSSAWVGSVTAFKGDSAWVATEDEEYLIPLSWMEHLEDAPPVDSIPVDKPTPPVEPKVDKQAGLFDVERPATSRVFSIDPQKVQIKAGMQFKKGANQEGVTEGDKIGEQESWDETMAGTFLFWQANDGTVYVADGHHRLSHAKRTGAELIHGYLLREQDGYTFQAARAHAALINIKNDKGTVYDHAAFFRDSQITEEEASNRGLLRKVMGRTGFMVGRFATDSVYEAFLNEDITPEKASVIAEVGKDNQAIQAVGLKWARTKRQTAEVLRESLRIFRDSRAASEGVLKKDKLKQLSIFEDYVPTDEELEAEREANAVASAVVKAKSELRETIRRHKALLANPDAARKQDVSFNEQTSKDLVEKSLIELDEWEHVGTNPELYERARLMAGLPPRATDGLGQEVANSYGGGGGRRRGSGYKGSGAAPANQPSTSFPFTPTQIQSPIPIGFLYDMALAIMGSAPEIKRLRGALGMAIHKEMLGVEHMRILIDTSAAIDVDLLRKVLAHEIGHIDDVIDPNSPALNTIKRGNLPGRIFKLRGFMQGQFLGVKNNDLRKELIGLTEWWSGPIAGSASYQRYRRKSRELYAEFLSVFLVSPGEAQARAPKFYAAFVDALNMDLHKPFKQELLAIQATLAGSPDAEADRMGRVMSEMWGEGQDAFLAHRKAIAESIYRPAAQVVTSFLAILLDNNSHAKSMAKHAVKQGVISEYERREYLATIDDLHHINSPGLAALGRFMQNVTWELEKANLPRSAFDDYMYQQRVMGDPGRQDKANPKATDAQAAAKGLAKMERELGPVKWAKLVQIGRNASDMMFSAFEEGYKEGLFTDEMMNQAKLNRYTYMPFVILQYYNGWVHPGVKQQHGTFLSTAPASEAITKKIMSLDRAITLNRAKRKTMDLAQKSFKYHASRLQTDNLGNLLAGQKIKTDLNDVLWVWEDGKEVPYEVDKFIVEMFKTHEIKSLEAVTNAIGNVIYSVWHPLFVTFSPKFMYRNFFRDPMRSAIGIPAYVAGVRKDRMRYLIEGGMSKTQAAAATKDMKVGSLELLFKYYGPALIKTWAAKKKKDAAFFAYYLEKGVFSEQIFTEPAHRVDLTDKTTELDKMFQEAGYQDVPDSARAAWKQKIAPIVRPIKYTAAPWLLRNIGRLNQVFELTSKVASTDAMVDAGLPDWAVKVGARKHAGTPDIMQRGSMTGPANAASMYFKVKVVGLASDASLATNPSSAFAWWWRTAIMGIAPVIANAIARMFWPGYKEAEDKIGDYLRKNYLTLFWPGVETSDGKQAIITIPMDETTRLVHSVTTNLFDAMRAGDDSRKSNLWKMFKNDWGAMVDQVIPSYNPAITIMGGWKDFLADDQPQDPFYKRPIINDRDWALRDEQPWDGVAKMAAWTFRQMGVLDIAYQAVGSPFSESYYGSEDKPWYSSTWKITGLDALVRTTDQGLSEIEHIETQKSELEGHRFRSKLTPKARSLSQEYEILRNKKPGELSSEEKTRKESLQQWMNGTYTPIRQAVQNSKEIGMTDSEVKDLYAQLNASAGELKVLDVDLSRGLREKTRIAQLNDDLSEPATIRDIGAKAASLLDTKMYLTKQEGEEARKAGITPEEMFRRIQAQMYSDRKVTKAWLKTRGITPQQAIEAYQVYAHERAANTRRKDGTPGKVDPASLRKSVIRLAGELQSQ